MVFLKWWLVWWVIGLVLIDWSQWQKGYATVLAGIVGSFFLDMTFVYQGFWKYHDPILPGMWPNITLNLGLYPIGTWIFVQKLPHRFWQRAVWVVLGASILIAVEFHLFSTGHIRYDHGWNIGYSWVANVVLLVLLMLHYRLVEKRLCRVR
jgi:hypothetical protein